MKICSKPLFLQTNIFFNEVYTFDMKESEFEVKYCDIFKNHFLKRMVFDLLRILYFTEFLWVLT